MPWALLMCHKLATYDLDSFWAGINGYLASSRIPFTVIITTVQFCEFGKSLTKKKNQVSYDFNISYITSQKKNDHITTRIVILKSRISYKDIIKRMAHGLLHDKRFIIV